MLGPIFKKKKIFSQPRQQSDEMALQITSMADIFTILLVFLLKSYATTSISPSAGLLLPSAQAGELGGDALKVEVSETGVAIEESPTVVLDHYTFLKGELNGDGTSKNLIAEFDRLRKKQLLIAKDNSSVKVDPRIVILSHKETPYGTLKAVLASAATQGYTDFKLAVVAAE